MLVSNTELSKESAYFDLEEFRALNRTQLEAAVLFEDGHLPTSRQDVLQVCDEIPDFKDQSIFCLEVFIEPANCQTTDSPFALVWQNIMEDAVIPFDLEERQRKFKRAYNELSEYIALWADPQPGTWRHQLLEHRAKWFNEDS